MTKPKSSAKPNRDAARQDPPPAMGLFSLVLHVAEARYLAGDQAKIAASPDGYRGYIADALVVGALAAASQFTQLALRDPSVLDGVLKAALQAFKDAELDLKSVPFIAALTDLQVALRTPPAGTARKSASKPAPTGHMTRAKRSHAVKKRAPSAARKSAAMKPAAAESK